MAVSASQLQELLKKSFPSDPAQMRVTDIMVPSGRINYVDEIIGYGESGPMYGSRPEPEMVVGGYYSPALGRALTAEESRYLIPITQNVDGQGQVKTGMVFPGESGIKAINQLGLDPSMMGGQATPQGFEIYPVLGIPTDQGERTNIALSYGGSGGPETRAYQTSTLTGNANLDKIVDQLAKAANAALLTQVGGLTLGPLGAGVLANPAVAGAVAGAGQAAIKGGDTKDLLTGAISGYLQAPGSAEITAASDLAKIEASMGPTAGMQLPRVPNFQLAPKLEDIFSGFGDYNEAAQNLLGQAQQSYMPFADFQPTLGSLINEPVRVPGDTRLVDTVAQPPLSVEDIAGKLTTEATALMGLPTGPMLPQMPSVPSISGGQVTGPNLPDLAGYEEAAGNLLAGAQQNFLNSGLTLSDFMSPEAFVGPTMGDLTKAALLTGAGYGEGLTPGEAPIMTSTPTIIGPGKDISALQIGKDIVGNLPGAMQQYVTTALTTLGLDADLVNKLVNWTPPTSTATTTQTGGGSGILGPVLGGLLSRQQGGAPAAPVIAGRAVDITSPIQALLAPKLVQQRPVTLL